MKAIRAVLLALVVIGAGLVPVAPAFADPEPALEVATVFPNAGDLEGGYPYNLSFTTPISEETTVTVDGQPVEAFFLPVGDALVFFTPPSSEVGPVDVVIADGDRIATQAFTYRDITLTPPTGLSTGGSVVTVSGGVFAETTTATVGGVEAAVDYVDASTVEVTVPANPAGAANLQLFTSEPFEQLAAGAFTYLDPLTVTPTPVITGSAVFGETLTADAGIWEPAPVDLAYQWFRGLDAISGAEASTYQLTVDDIGATVSVTVAGSKPGYAPAATASEPTATITAAELTSAPTPVVSGGTAFGDTLTADAGSWEPAAVDLGYQWLRGSDPIPGETGPTYTLTTDDIGSTVSVTVTGTKPGYTSQSRTSDPTTAITPAVLTQTPVPTISGTTQFGETLTADPGSWEPAVVDLAYQWLRDGEVIAGAEASTYSLTLDDLGATISVKVTGSKPGYAPVTVESAATAAITPATLTATPTPVLTGSAVFGETLTVDAGSWEPSVVDLAYQWFRNSTPISGATGTTYTLTVDDLTATITVEVTGSKLGYAPITTSATSAVIEPATLTAPVPTISGETTFGEDLVAAPGSWTSGTQLTYQWYRGSAPIGGATGTTYRITDADIGLTITVAVTGSKAGYATATTTSVATAVVAAAVFTSTPMPGPAGTPKVGRVIGLAPFTWEPGVVTFTYQWKRNGVPIVGATGSTYSTTMLDRDKDLTVTITGTKVGYATKSVTTPPRGITSYPLSGPLPTIVGTPRIGSTLSIGAASTDWTYGATLTYQWKRNGAAIAGATASTYTVSIADYTNNISVTVTGSLSGFSPVSKSSQATAAVQLGTFTTVAPTISGTARVASTLTAVPGDWEPSAGTFSYAWKRSGTGIPGATGSTYKLTATDVGKTITVTVTAKADGYLNASRTSAATATIAAGLISGTTPVVTGTAKVGSVLTVTKGAWSPSAAAISYQWKRNGVAISGATATTYTLTKTDAGSTITATVRASLTGYTTTYKTSAATAIVTGGVLTSAIPTIAGTTKVGATLAAVSGTWSPAPVTLKYQWKRNGVAISGATTSTYKLVTADSGKLISVTVTGSKTGYTTKSSTSASTATIRP